jgi:hypothetical protein
MIEKLWSALFQREAIKIYTHHSGCEVQTKSYVKTLRASEQRSMLCALNLRYRSLLSGLAVRNERIKSPHSVSS